MGYGIHNISTLSLIPVVHSCSTPIPVVPYALVPQCKQNRRWGLVWSGVLVFFVAVYLFLALHQTLKPWELKHHAHFYGEQNCVWLLASA